MANKELHNEIQATLYRRHKVSYGVPFDQRALFNTLWLGFCLNYTPPTHGELHNMAEILYVVVLDNWQLPEVVSLSETNASVNNTRFADLRHRVLLSGIVFVS